MTKYQPLREHLNAQSSPRVQMAFKEVEQVLGEALPESAFKYREWWANQSDTTNRPQAAAWLDAGFRVQSVQQDAASG